MQHWLSRPSTVDWCEENYVYSTYVAEFWNTLSSLFLSYAGYVGYIRNRRWNGSFVFIVLMIVGVGSAYFHGSLTAHSQMYDEIPMIFLLQWISVNALNIRSVRGIMVSYASSVAFSTIVIVTAFLKDAESSRIEFYLFQSTVVLAGAYIFRLLLTKAVMKRHIRNIFKRGCSVFFVAWCCWLCDYFFCSFFRQGNPQLHAWWHLGSAIGVYHLCILSIILRNPDKNLYVSEDVWTWMNLRLPVVFTSLTTECKEQPRN